MSKRGPKPKTARTTRSAAPVTGWTPPPYLSSEAEAAWRHVVGLVESTGNLNRTDPTLIEAYAVNVAMLRKAQESIDTEGITFVNGVSGSISANPACAILNAATMRVKAIIADLGLCPATSKYAAETGGKKPEASKWGDMLNVVG